MRGNLKDFVYSNIITSLFAFGGGVSFLPFFQEYYLNKYQFLDSSRFYELFGYASATPGPISPLFAGVVGFEPTEQLWTLNYGFEDRWPQPLVETPVF